MGLKQWLLSGALGPCILFYAMSSYANLLDLESEFEAFQAQNPELVAEEPTGSAESTNNARQTVQENNPSEQAENAEQTGEALTAATDKTEQDKSVPSWSYQGDSGPKAWGDLHNTFRVCKHGRVQSPVNIIADQAVSAPGLSDLSTDYRAMPLRLQKSTTSLISSIPLGSPLVKAGVAYQLIEVQFKTPSEHQLDGFDYPLEIQFHHRDSHGQALVVSVLVREGDSHAQLEQVLNHLPREADRLRIYEGVPFQPRNLWPDSQDYFRYLGSQTQPPCEEGVIWVVMREPIEASIRQLLGFQNLLGRNARPIQPLNGRLPLKSWQDASSQPTQTQQDNRRLDEYRGYFFSF
ncbi:carbonic anhydrase [Thiomicrospira sp. ALE5]|uniref:carbonic anhydrase n=1 Tax=Thiomicrospira sp. ALE5 TaxID=748650 RepID=UPI0008EDE535|nr:carbonic anhydrase family protein [Thiomicrospira sp. ALE5]SFR60066.1 carbonic anhydrase [Thiomicrospira sp. ALE5]